MIAPSRPDRSPGLGTPPSPSNGTLVVRLLVASLDWLRRAVIELDRAIRIHFLGASIMIALLGAASVSPQLGTDVLLALLVVALCFHTYAYVLNDVVDLRVDRNQPLRAQDPLVRGAVGPRQALAVALLQIPMAILVTRWIGGGELAYFSLGCGFGLMAIYNVWGKRCVVPPLTDGVQGLAWGCLGLYGAAIAGSPTVLTAVAAGYMAGFILLINGIHGGLRDLENDLRCSRRTTAIFLGARPLGDAALNISASVRVFSFSVQVALLALIATPLLRNDFAYGPGTWALTFAAVGILGALDLLLLGKVLKPEKPLWHVTVRLHLCLLLLTLVVLFVPYLSAQLRVLLVATFFAPLLVLDTPYVIARWLWRVVSSSTMPWMSRE